MDLSARLCWSRAVVPARGGDGEMLSRHAGRSLCSTPTKLGEAGPARSCCHVRADVTDPDEWSPPSRWRVAGPLPAW